MIADNERRHSCEITEFRICQLDIPEHLAILCIQTDQMAVRGFKVKQILVHTDPAIADVIALRFQDIMPDQSPCPRIGSKHIVRCREIEPAVYFNGHRLDTD